MSKYRPSNGTEGEMFMDRFCFNCARDENNDCPILLASLVCDVDDPEYPEEWVRDESGFGGTCTAYVESEG